MPDAELPLPSAELIARARAFRDDGGAVAAAKLAATVVLLRDGESGVEVFMMRRHTTMSFGAGMHVFPGGVVDPADTVGRTEEQALVTAAIRETFEECGVLFATGLLADPEQLEADRRALIAHETTLDDMLANHGLTAAPEQLRPWSRWITPEFEPRRYDTMFYVAVIAAGHEARDVGGESDTATWTSISAALSAQQAGDWLLMPPTEQTLRELAGYSSSAEIFAAARDREIAPLLAAIDLDADPPRFELTDPSGT